MGFITKEAFKEEDEAQKTNKRTGPQMNVGPNMGRESTPTQSILGVKIKGTSPVQSEIEDDNATGKNDLKAKRQADKTPWGGYNNTAPNYKKGGSVKSSASSRGDGIATKGKTKGRIC